MLCLRPIVYFTRTVSMEKEIRERSKLERINIETVRNRKKDEKSRYRKMKQLFFRLTVRFFLFFKKRCQVVACIVL